MKKLILSTALCLIVFAAFSQKKNVNAVKSEISASKPNFAQAQTLMAEALEDPETKDNPETWYVAGSLEDKIFTNENNKTILKQQPDSTVMYEALIKSYDLFLKVFDLEKIPNEKGKISDKFSKQVKSILKINHPDYVNGGVYYYANKNYDKAYTAFNTYLEIPQLDIFKKDKLAADNVYNQIALYASYSANYVGNSERAIQILESLKEKNYEKELVYSSLIDAYRDAKDSVRCMNTLLESAKQFPKNMYFIQNLINEYIKTGQREKAITYLDEAIAQEPGDPQYWSVKGDLYFADKNEEKALAAYKEALNVNPDYVPALGAIGSLYYNKGFELQTKANEMSIQQAKAEEGKIKELYAKALPYLEKAHKLSPDEKDYVRALYAVYYRLNMPQQMEEMEKLLD